MAMHIPRYLVHQAYITTGSIALFALLIALGENAEGWDGLTYLIIALGAAALWAVISAAYMIWVIIRERGRRASWPAMGVLAAVLILGALFALWVDAH